MPETLSYQLREMVAMLLDLDPESIDENDEFAKLGVDSLMRLEIIAFVEQSMGQQIPSETLPNLASIREVIGYVESLR